MAFKFYVKKISLSFFAPLSLYVKKAILNVIFFYLAVFVYIKSNFVIKMLPKISAPNFITPATHTHIHSQTLYKFQFESNTTSLFNPHII